jgi:hypothetical protein
MTFKKNGPRPNAPLLPSLSVCSASMAGNEVAGDDIHCGELHPAPQLAVMWASGGLQYSTVLSMHSQMYCSAMHPRPALLRSAGSLLLLFITATRSLAGFPATIVPIPLIHCCKYIWNTGRRERLFHHEFLQLPASTTKSETQVQ